MSRGVLIGVALRLLGRYLLGIGALAGAFALGHGSLSLSREGGPPGELAFIIQNVALFAVLGLVLLRQWRWLARKLAGRPGQVRLTESGLRWATAGALGTLALYSVGIRAVPAAREGLLLDPGAAPHLQWLIAAYTVLAILLYGGTRRRRVRAAPLQARDFERAGLFALGAWWAANGLSAVVASFSHDVWGPLAPAHMRVFLPAVLVMGGVGYLLLRAGIRGRTRGAAPLPLAAWVTAMALLYAVAGHAARWVAEAIHGTPPPSGDWVADELGAVTVGVNPGLGSTGASLLVVLVCAAALLVFAHRKPTSRDPAEVFE